MSVDDTADFSKQRRNLIIISGVLLLHEFLGIDYKDFKVFGMTITQSENITLVIWIVWLYFFIRYFNLFFQILEKGIGVFFNKIINKFDDYSIHKYLKELNLNKNSNYNINKDDNVFWKRGRTLYLTTASSSEDRKSKSYKFSFLTHLYIFTCAGFYIIFKTHYFSEYYFPIIFGLSPLLILLHKNLGVLVSWW